MNIATSKAPAPLLPDRFRKGAVVIAQLGQTLDGRIATVTGASKYINGTAALDHLHRLRAEVDAVIVGVGTAIADDPQLTVRRCEGAHPARVVIDPNGRVPASLGMFGDGEAEVLVVTRPGGDVPDGADRIEVEERDGALPPAAILAALRARGLARILLEGGADTLARFLDADAVDLLHILMAPMILGSGKAGLALAPVERLDQARRPQTRVHVFEDGDVLFTCDLRREWERDG
ncbi:RibD family protein [Roseobacter sp. HKCCA0434]|uniref:RibD family protein n=1 Tax=Roseobacter sp. HKCCA0434 TaxID=3079297 RepID=UPI002905B882|nr:RibD family protein [Roseobacter sp. HKCCA0434]